MIVRCPSCEARFHLADGRLPEKGARVRCSKCHHRFYVRPPGADAQGSDAELEAESEPDAAPVSRQGKPAPEAAKSAKAAKPGKAPAAAAKPAPSAAKPAKPAAPTPAAPKPAAAAAKPAQAKPATRTPPAAPARSGSASGGADDPDLEDPQFLFDKAEAPRPSRPAAKSPAPKAAAPERSSSSADVLGGGAALFGDDDDERVEATLGEEEAVAGDHDARSDLFGDMAGLAAETEAADAERSGTPPPKAKAAPAPAPSPARASAPAAREEPMLTIGSQDSEPPLDVRAPSASYQTGGSREQVERKPAAPRAATRPASEPTTAPPPVADTPRTRLLRALGCVAGVALAFSGARLLASHATGPLAGPERLAGPGWEVHGVQVLRLRAAEGQLVLAVRGTLDRTGGGALPVLRATPADDSGEPVGGDTPVSWNWLDGGELAPDRLSHWIAAAPEPAPAADSPSIASARFTVLIVNPPAAARRILLRSS